MSLVGIAHTVFALGAMLSGSIVVLRRKGTSRHRQWGRVYVVSMVGLNLTALLIYRLFHSFGPFHWGALLSLGTVVAGFLNVRSNRPLHVWVPRHATFMSWSYAGLLAAAAAEAATRLTKGFSWGTVAAATALVLLLSGWVVRQRLPSTIRGVVGRGFPNQD